MKREAEQTEGRQYTTTKRLEWWGWFGSAVWFFFMMYGHDNFLTGDLVSKDSSSLPPFLFSFFLGLSIIAFGWLFGRDPDRLSRIGFITAPIGIALTAVFAFAPQPYREVIYVILPFFMAPAITRRIYGIIRTAAPGKRLIRYMSGIVACVFAFTTWNIAFSGLAGAGAKAGLAFIVPALLAVPIWISIRRSAAIPESLPESGKLHLSRNNILVLVAIVIILFLVDSLFASIHTQVIMNGSGGLELGVVYTIIGFMLPPIGYVIYAIINDRGHERMAFICGMGLAIIGIMLAMISVASYTPGVSLHPIMLPLAITDGLGGSYTEFLILTVPVFFFDNAKKPVLVASLGLAFDIISSALLWVASYWMPQPLLDLSMLQLIVTAILTVIFIILVFFLFEKYREKTLAAALFRMLRREVVAEQVDGANEPADSASETERAEIHIKSIDIFEPDERRIAELLMDGYTSGEIAHKLHIPASEVGSIIRSLRSKVVREPSAEILDRIASDYKLTRREAHILRGIYEGKTNTMIADESFVSLETVKFHSKNLIRKLPVDSRASLYDWLLSGAE